MALKVQLLYGPQSSTFEAGDSSSLLDQALSNGADVSYACKRGDCHQCAATLVDGSVRAFEEAMPWKLNNTIYLCNAVACSDLTLKLPYAPELARIQKKQSPCKIHEITFLSDDVVEITLRLPPSTQFDFLAGQYIRLTTQKKQTRSYSLAFEARPDKLLRLHIRRVPGGMFSQHLFEEARPGDLLYLDGPHGHFFISDSKTVSKTIFLATGTGIAPINAILSSLDEAGRARCGELFVYWGNRARQDAYGVDRLRILAEDKKFLFFPVFSRENTTSQAETCRHVQDLMSRHHDDLTFAQVYASGNSSMIEAARQKCESLGLPPENFCSDAFTAS